MMSSTTDHPNPAPKDLYAAAGVDTDKAEEGLQRLIANVRSTWPAREAEIGGVQLPIGYFANVIRIGNLGIALCTDGIGSKAVLAQMMHRYDTVGIDCVAMNVNDVLCVGARPLSMVDYIAVEQAQPELLEALSIGLTKGARQAGVSISGGEISQIKDIIKGHRPGWGFDLVGMAVGDVALDKINDGARVAPGDVIIGIESNGIHSNGLTLARRAFFEQNKFALEHKFAELALPLGEELLLPTHIYVKEVLEVLARIPEVAALAHITSDGFLNLTRVAAPVGYVIDALPPPPPIFSLIEKFGSVESPEMYQVFNMGIGFCLVVKPRFAAETISILAGFGRKAHKIGRATAEHPKEVRLIDAHGRHLVGQHKRFRFA
jgi:phosphoribosylformylglycinamidine cyclo-ligase